MTKFSCAILLGSSLTLLGGWPTQAETTATTTDSKNFDADAALVQKRFPTVVIADPATGAKVLVAPALQGRVLTSAPGGPDAPSCGWINHELLASGKLQPHINAYGGEDRLWLGPEGGQYGLYFAPGVPYDFAHWQTPALLDTEPFDVMTQGPDTVVLRKDAEVVNHAGTKFQVRIDRTVRLLGAAEIWHDLNAAPRQDVQAVGYQSDNALTNRGPAAWTKSAGLLSIWILGQFNASPHTMVLIPYRQGPETELGPVVESDYFGTVPADRLQVGDGMIRFRVDGHFRSKLGLNPRRAMPIMAGYDAANHLLTFVQSSPPEPAADYVNSLWKEQEHPYAGSAVNSYNDGPNDTGKQLGNFYEMETSSPAVALAPQQTVQHFQRTIHLHGSADALAAVAHEVLGADLNALGQESSR